MEILKEINSPVLKENPVIQLHCIDKETLVDEQVDNLPNLSFGLVVGHVSLIEELAERRFLFFLGQDGVNALEDLPSPVFIEVKSSCLFEVSSERVMEVICAFNVVDNSVGTINAIRPSEKMSTAHFSTIPYLDLSSCRYCNCFNHPRRGTILVESGTKLDQENAEDKTESNGLKSSHASVPCDDLNDEASFYTQKFTLKGISFHPDFQVTIKRSRELIAQQHNLELKLVRETDNFEDSNAVVVQVKMQGHWKSIGYIPAKKVPKVQIAIHKKEITLIRFESIRKKYFQAIQQHLYTPSVLITKLHPWLLDQPDYQYNDSIDLS